MSVSPDVVPTMEPVNKPYNETVTSISVEQQQEQILKSKYGNLAKKGGSSLLQKRLAQKGGNKYFDSGDYNMARAKVGGKQKIPIEVKKEVTGDHMPTPDELPRVRKASQSSLVIPQLN
ncbi:cAMP-regulated phosphoprotein 19 [Ciona intestinalis]